MKVWSNMLQKKAWAGGLKKSIPNNTLGVKKEIPKSPWSINAWLPVNASIVNGKINVYAVIKNPIIIPTIAALDEPLFQNKPIKNDGANCDTITNEINPMEYKDSSIEKLT